MAVDIRVKERPTGTFQLGAGFSNVENIIVTGQISQNNFLGRGQTLSASLQWSAFRRIFDLRFVDPYFVYIGQAPLTFSFTAYNTQRFMVGFARNSSGGDLTFRLPHRTSFRWRHFFQNASKTNPSSTAGLYPRPRQYSFFWYLQRGAGTN